MVIIMYIDKNSETPYIKKHIGELIPGDILLHPLFRTDGLMLVDKYKSLSESIIILIRKHIPYDLSVLVIPALAGLSTLSSDNQNSSEFKKDLHQLIKENNDNTDRIRYDTMDPIDTQPDNPIIHALTSCPYWNFFDSKLESEHLKKRALHIKNELLTLIKNNVIFVSFFNRIKSYDDVLLIHSLNSACVSIMIGITLEMENEDILDLAIAALFSNIGFTELPRRDFKNFLKSQQFNNNEMKKHIEIFSNITSASPYLRKKSIIHGILDHHEYYNGNGYPNEKKGEEISLFGRILNIALAYDSMVGGYNYTVGLTPSEAFDIIIENSEMKFDPNIVSIFFNRTTYYKLGETMLLSDGSAVKIIGFKNYIKHPNRPIIKYKNGRIVNLLA